MTVKASSNKPGFSYLVGVTDKTCSKLQNLTEALSCGRRGIIGNRLFNVDIVCVESVESVDCERAGDAVRDLDCQCCCWKSLNLLLRIKFSKSLDSSVASKLAIVDPIGRCDLAIASVLPPDCRLDTGIFQFFLISNENCLILLSSFVICLCRVIPPR